LIYNWNIRRAQKKAVKRKDIWNWGTCCWRQTPN